MAVLRHVLRCGGDDAHRGHYHGSVSAEHGHGEACRGVGSSKAHVRTCSQGVHRGHGCDKAQGVTVMGMPEGEHGYSKAHRERTAKNHMGTQSWWTV